MSRSMGTARMASIHAPTTARPQRPAPSLAQPRATPRGKDRAAETTVTSSVEPRAAPRYLTTDWPRK